MGSSLPVILAAGDPGYDPINLSPEGRLEIAWNAGYLTPAADRIWTDVSDRVERGQLGGPISIERGRADQHSTVQPSRLTLTLRNTDGRFTPEYAAGAYYPNVKKGRPIRVSCTTVAGTAFILFTGYIDVWPVAWPTGADTYSSVTITATSRMARLGKSLEFRSIVEEEYLYDDPIFYWPLGESAGALEAGNIAPGRSERLVVTQVGSGGTLEFGAGIGPGTDSLTAPVFTPVDQNNGLALIAQLTSPVTQLGDHHLAVEAFFSTSVTTHGQIATAVYSRYADTASSTLFYVGVDSSTGKARAQLSDTVNAIGVNVLSAGSVADGNVHHAVARASLDDGTGQVVLTLVIDGVATSSAGVAWPYVSGGIRFFPAMSEVSVGGAYAGTLFEGTVAHAAVGVQAATAVTDARYAAHYHAGADGFTADSSDERIARYARLAGIPTAEVTVEAGLSASIAHKDTTGQTAVSMMQAVELTEDGVVFDARDGTLTFHARSHRYNSTSAFTLDCAAQEVEATLSPVLDDQGLLNDIKATREGGAEAHAVNQASINELGYYRETFDLMTTSDNEVQSRANWEVNRRGTPRVKLTSVTVDLVASSPAQQALLLAADIGTRFTVTNLPAQAPASTMDFFVEGISEDIDAEHFTVTFNTSADAFQNVWILGSASYSQLGSTSVLAY